MILNYKIQRHYNYNNSGNQVSSQFDKARQGLIESILNNQPNGKGANLISKFGTVIFNPDSGLDNLGYAETYNY